MLRIFCTSLALSFQNIKPSELILRV